MRFVLPAMIAAIAFAGARAAREAAGAHPGAAEVKAPYTPSPATARFLSLGYHEAFADVLYVRMRGYFGSYYGTSAGALASLAEAIVELDPTFKRVYEVGASAMSLAPEGVDNSIYLRAIGLLERGIVEFPRDWSMPLLAGQIYIQDLHTKDPEQRREWDERGVALVESAIRKPNAPQKAAIWAAHVRTRLGQVERAAEGIRELLLTTTDASIRKALLERLANLEKSNAAELAAEILGARQQFERAWRAERFSVNPSMYILLGPQLTPGFDLAELAIGGRELLFQEAAEQLEPP